MNIRKSLPLRGIALVLALILLISNGTVGLITPVFAVTNERVTVTDGDLVAENYDMPESQKSLLKSGLLSGSSYSFNKPNDPENLISVNIAAKTIEAKEFNGGSGYIWKPVSADLIDPDGKVVESGISLTSGTGTYTYTGDAFSLEVEYALTISVSAQKQSALLDAAYVLKQGVANLDTISGQQGNLYVLEKAMPELVKFADEGIVTSIASFGFSTDCKNAVYWLDNQMTANGGKLSLSILAAEYDNGSKSEFLLNKGTKMRSEVSAFVERMTILNEALTTMASNMEIFIKNGWLPKETGEQLKTLAGIAGNLESTLSPVAAEPWDSATTGLLAENASYVSLDQYVANLGDGLTRASDVTIREGLRTTVTLVRNTSMVDVTIAVNVHYYNDRGALTQASRNTVRKMAGGTSIDSVRAAARTLEAELEALGIDLSCYNAALDTNIGSAVDGQNPNQYYTLTYTPKNHTVTFAYDGNSQKTYQYGQWIVLPSHPDPAMSYDYFIGGVTYRQGDVYIVRGSVTIDRAVGKAYTVTDLYSVVAGNFGNSVTQGILGSGALKNNEIIHVRKPDHTDAEALLTLSQGTLTVESAYPSDYAGLNWTPYSYGANGTENRFSGYTVAWSENAVKVRYILNLTNHSVSEVQQILDLAVTLKQEAQGQKEVLDRLASYHTTMGQLDKVKLGVLSGVIDVTDFTPGDGNENDAKNLELRAYFKSVVGSIIANSLDSNNQLKIYNILGAYLDSNSGGLLYYYQNSDTVLAEIDALSGYLSDLLADDEKKAALEVMVGSAGYPEYAEKIAGLEQIMAEVRAALAAPNAAIDVRSENLNRLVEALESSGQVVNETAGTAWIMSDSITALDESRVMVQIIVNAGGTTGTFTTPDYDYGTVLTQAAVDSLMAQVKTFVDTTLGTKVGYYDLSVQGPDLNALVGTSLKETVNVYHTYAPKVYTVKIQGEADQTVTVQNLTILLPSHTTPGYVYKYTIDGTVRDQGSYTFKTEQLDRLFKNGVYTITRTAVNEGEARIEEMVAALNKAVGASASKPAFVLTKSNGIYTGLTANISTSDFMNFAMGLLNSGYSYVGLNGSGLVYLNESGSVEISAQTLIDAVLWDNSFGSQTLITLGNQGRGKLLTTSMQLGNSASDLHYNNLELTINLTAVPGKLGTLCRALGKIDPYMNFQSRDGVMTVGLDLPEKAYEAYLTALLATGNLDRSDVNAIDQQIAFRFLYDYVEVLMDSEADTKTFTNTLKKLGHSRDLTGFENYYQFVKEFLNHEGTSVDFDQEGMVMSVDFEGKHFVEELLILAGIDPVALSVQLGMIKEYKPGGTFKGTAVAHLDNTEAKYQAAVLDLNAASTLNKIDYTDNLSARVGSIAGDAVVLLLSDVTGDLNFGGGTGCTVILDLNGMTLKGNINASCSLIITDSTLDTDEGGRVTGTVTGNVSVMGGTFAADVSGFLKEGYVQENGAVHSVRYTVDTDDTGSVTVFLIPDAVTGYLPDAQALGMDIALDVAMNYISSASLSVNGKPVFSANALDMESLVQGSRDVATLINKTLDCVSADGVSGFVNRVISDLLNFTAIENAAANGGPIASYSLRTSHWSISLVHVKNETEDYLDLTVGPNTENHKAATLTLTFAPGDHSGVAALAGAMKNIVKKSVITVALDRPQFDRTTRTLKVTGSAAMDVDVDLTTNEEYITVMAVLIASVAGESTRTALITALNEEDFKGLQAAFDQVTLAELNSAFRSLKPDTDFAAMAKALGVEAETAVAARLEGVFHGYLCALARFLPVETDTAALSTLSTGEGWYEFDENRLLQGGTLGGDVYNAHCVLTTGDVALSLRILNPSADFKGAIEVQDANGNTLIRTNNFEKAWEVLVSQLGTGIILHKEVTLVSGAYTLPQSILVVNPEKLTMEDAYFFIADAQHQLSTSADVLKVGSTVPNFTAAYNGAAYALTAITVTTARPDVALSWIEDQHLFLDLHPMNGLSLNGLSQAMTLTGGQTDSVRLTIAGNDGTGLVKTADKITVEFVHGSHVVATANYTVIVVGDTNLDGVIQAGDAIVMMNIYNGVTYSTDGEARLLAADAARNGIVQAGDATRIMTKWFLLAESGDPEEAWAKWLEMVDEIHENQ